MFLFTNSVAKTIFFLQIQQSMEACLFNKFYLPCVFFLQICLHWLISRKYWFSWSWGLKLKKDEKCEIDELMSGKLVCRKFLPILKLFIPFQQSNMSIWKLRKKYWFLLRIAREISMIDFTQLKTALCSNICEWVQFAIS